MPPKPPSASIEQIIPEQERTRPADRRREPRYPACNPARVDLLDGSGQNLPGTVVDISRSGLGLLLAAPVQKNTRMRILIEPDSEVLAEARYCRQVSNGFQVGVLIREMRSSAKQPERHAEDDELELYLIGKGLKFAETVRLQRHLQYCESCGARLKAVDAILNPVRRREKISVLRSQ